MRRASLALACLFAGFGTIPLVSRQIELDGAAVAFARVLVGATALGLVVAVTRPPGPGLYTLHRGRVIASGCALGVHWATQFAGYQRAPAATVSLVIYLAPVGVAALAPVVLGERRTRRTLVALGLGVAGFVLVAAAGGGTGPGADDTLGLLFAAASAASLVVLTLLAKPLAGVYGGLRLGLMQMAVATAVLAPVALADDWSSGADALGWLALLGLAHTAFGGVVYLAMLARVRATHASILGYIEPVSVAALAWIVLGEAFGVATAIGGGLVVAAGWLVITATPDDVAAAHGEALVGTVPG